MKAIRLYGCAILAVLASLLAGCSRGLPTPTQLATGTTSQPAPVAPATTTVVPTAAPTVTPTLVPTLAATDTPVPERRYPGRIAYVRIGATSMDIYTARSDGSDEKLVARGEPVATMPQWLPDGRHLAYLLTARSARDGETTELWVADTAGDDEPRRVDRDGTWKYQLLSWSPDGSTAVFDTAGQDGKGQDIYLLNMATGQVTTLVGDPAAWDAGPEWSPAGNRIAYYSNRGDDKMADIWLINPDGTGGVNLTNNGRDWEDVTPAWSPDGTRIALFRYAPGAQPGVPGGPPGLWTMAADGSDPRLVAELEGRPVFELPVWSPDGTQIAYCWPTSDNMVILWVVEAAGGEPQRLSPDPMKSCMASWSPDSQAVTFAMEAEEGASQLVYAADGSELYALVEGTATNFGWWSPPSGPFTAVAPELASGPRPTSLPTPAPEPQPTAITQAYPGLIALSTGADGFVDIYATRPDGSGPIRLTRERAEAYSPRWSPDGEKVAFEMYDRAKDQTDLWVLSVSPALQAEAITRDGGWDLREKAWSPDGTAIVSWGFVDGGGESDVLLADLASGKVANLSADLDAWVWNADPTWSPDGKWLAYVTDREEKGQVLDRICLMRPDGSDWHCLTSGADWEDEEPTWSPDGREIAFVRWGIGNLLGETSPPGGPPGLWAVDVESQQERLITDKAKYDIELELAWSPDGETIAFTMVPEGSKSEEMDVWVAPARGGKPVNVSRLPGREWSISWSPDSRALTFTNDSGEGYSQWVAAVDGSSKVQIATGGLGHWSPVGTMSLLTEKK